MPHIVALFCGAQVTHPRCDSELQGDFATGIRKIAPFAGEEGCQFSDTTQNFIASARHSN